MVYELDKLETSEIYKLISSTIIPRPIAWIVTNYKDIINIAPFSYFTPLSSNPPTLIVSIGHKKDGNKKDTLINILENKKATICMANESDLEKLKLSATSLDRIESEAKKYKIETKIVFDDFPPMIKNSNVAFFCTFNQIVNIKSPTIPVILNIEKIYIKDLDSHNPISRVAKEFATIGNRLN